MLIWFFIFIFLMVIVKVSERSISFSSSSLRLFSSPSNWKLSEPSSRYLFFKIPQHLNLRGEGYVVTLLLYVYLLFIYHKCALVKRTLCIAFFLVWGDCLVISNQRNSQGASKMKNFRYCKMLIVKWLSF